MLRDDLKVKKYSLHVDSVVCLGHRGGSPGRCLSPGPWAPRVPPALFIPIMLSSSGMQ